MAKKTQVKAMTRAQKTEATKSIIKELLAKKPTRHNELIEEVAKLYSARHQGEDTENVNDVKGRVGSVLDIMKKESEVMYDGGMYALKARMPMSAPTPAPVEEKAEETPAPKKRTRAKKVAEPVPTEEKGVETAPVEEKSAEEKPTPKKRGRAKKTVEAMPVPPVEEKAETPVPIEEKPAPKKRGRKPKAAKEATPVVAPIEESKTETPVAPATTEEKPVKEKTEPVKAAQPVEEKKPEPPVREEKAELIVKPKGEIAQKSVVMDMSFLFGDRGAKPAQKEAKNDKVEEKQAPMSATKEEKVVPTPVKVEGQQPKKEESKPTAAKPKTESKPTQKTSAKKPQSRPTRTATEKPMTAEEKLKESFLKRMRTLGGDYFEYYSVYLLERYSMKNGRRLEGLHISGGDHDGGIDGEIELTDKLGFKETIYIQSKNWDPEKGKEENWVVGETLLQQFIGACACRQAKDKKQHCRGIFITTSRFTPDAKRILDTMSDKIVGYDGNDLFEAAKECSFGLVKKNGEWSLDENLLSGAKAFFQML